MWLSELGLAVRNSWAIQGRSRRCRCRLRGERLRSQARPYPSPGTAQVVAISSYVYNRSLTGYLFLFHLQEEAARILAHQTVSVGTCAALKTHTLQWMCKRSCMEKIVVCPLLSLSWVFLLSNLETDVVHAIKNEEPFTCHGLHDCLNLIVHCS